MIVDVLSFSTSVTVAVQRGMRVFPYRWKGAQVEEFAAAHRAVLAVGWLAPALEAGRSVTVIAAGERWSGDNSLRPALEDHLGAGAVLSALTALGHGQRFSPEAHAAADLFDVSASRPSETDSEPLRPASTRLGGRSLSLGDCVTCNIGAWPYETE